jgi:hypothetical protein
MAHFPIFTNGCHQHVPNVHEEPDNQMTRKHWLGMFMDKTNPVVPPDIYLCGHNHDLEHIEKTEEVSTSFITSGGGGGEGTYPLRNNLYGPFARQLHGFVHLRFGDTMAEVIIVGAKKPAKIAEFKPEDFTVVHAFKRELATGKVEITVAPGPQLDPPGKCPK